MQSKERKEEKEEGSDRDNRELKKKGSGGYCGNGDVC